ncbi:MAG: GNAT family N-acetyltransferase [Myxococcota bacterium]
MRPEPKLAETLEEALGEILARYIEAQQTVGLESAGEVWRRHPLIAVADRAGLESCVMGFHDQADASSIKSAVRWLEARSDSLRPGEKFSAPGLRAVVSPLTGESQLELLGTLGFAYRYGSMVLLWEGDPSPNSQPRSDVRVESFVGRDSESVVEVITRGFVDGDTPTERQRLVGRTYAALPSCTHFGAFVGGTLAGGAALVLGQDLAYLTGMSVLPAFRGRHLQTALIEARIQRAIEHGVRILFATAKPLSRSQRNLERSGFRPLYARSSLVRPAR